MSKGIEPYRLVQQLDFGLQFLINQNTRAILPFIKQEEKMGEQMDTPEKKMKPRLHRKPTAFERRVEERVTKAVAAELDQHQALTETGDEKGGLQTAPASAEDTPVSGPAQTQPDSPFAQALYILQTSDLASNPKALRLLADLAELAQGGAPTPQPRASHLIQPSGGGLPAPDLRREYKRRISALRQGDVAGLMEIKREFRKRGLEIY